MPAIKAWSSPYSDVYGGAVINATISMYAYAGIEPRDDGKLEIISIDGNEAVSTIAKPEIEIDGKLDFIKGVYNRIVRDFNKGKPLSFFYLYFFCCSCRIWTWNIVYNGCIYDWCICRIVATPTRRV
jgi:hypothetical protein